MIGDKNMNAEFQRLIEAEVERKVIERLKEERETLSKKDILERFEGIFGRMDEQEQIAFLLKIISPSEESLCDSFGEGTWGMSKNYKASVAITMILQNLLNK